MAIKPTKLRAVFLLLLFTLLFVASNSLIIEVNADSPEESFKNTPLSFWDIETENSLVQYGTNTQEVLFSYGEHLEDFNDISEWEIESVLEPNTEFITNNGIGNFIFDIDSSDNNWEEWSFPITCPSIYYYIEIEYYFDSSDFIDFFQFDFYEGVSATGHSFWFRPPLSLTWNTYSVFIPSTIIIGTPESFASVRLAIRADIGTNSNLYIKYIHVFEYYNEDMSDVSDWAYHTGFGYGDYHGIDTDGDIGELFLWTQSAEDEYVHYKTPMNYLITENTKFRIKSKVESILITLGTRITGTDLNVFPSSCANTNWQIQNPDITDQAGKVIDWLFIYIDDNPNNGAVGNYSAYFDYIEIWETGGAFNVSIPIEQFKNHKLEFMLDTDDLDNTTKLDFGIFQNDEVMNYDFYLQNQILIQRDFSFDYSEYNYLRFILDLKYSTNYFRLSGYDENNSKLFSNVIYEYVRKTGDNFRISSENITGWFHLYYFTGSVDYATTWTETIINQDPDIENYMLSASSFEDDILIDHEITYDRYISNFQFLRTNMYLYTDWSASGEWYITNEITVQLFYPDGTELYRVVGLFRRYNQNIFFSITIYEDDIEIYYTSGTDYTVGVESDANVQFAVWRTQDNKLGTLFNDVDGKFAGYIYGTPKFIGDRQLENFQANITILYLTTPASSGYQNFLYEMSGFELGYGRVEGVAEPHFSTTWWETIPFLGPIIGAFMLVGDAIILALELGLSPVTIFLDSIFSAIGGIAGMVWVLFESALSDLGISIDAVASDVFGFFDAILTSISGLVDDVITGITNLNDNFVAWVSEGITDVLVPLILAGIEDIIDATFALWEYQLNLVGTALGWGNVGTFLFDFTDSVVLTIPSWLEFIISINIMMIDIFIFVNALYAEYGPTFILYGCLFIAIDILTAVMTLDIDIIGNCLIKYIKVIAWIAEFMLSIISTVLNAIWGILPF